MISIIISSNSVICVLCSLMVYCEELQPGRVGSVSNFIIQEYPLVLLSVSACKLISGCVFSANRGIFFHLEASMKFLKNDTLRLGVCSVVILASGISGCGTKKSTDTPAAAVPVATGSAVDDPVAQQLVVSDQVNNVVAAVSDGGSGTSSDLSIGNESAVGLTDMGLTAFTETRSCAVNPLTAEKSMVGADGSTWALDSGMTSITTRY